jgi:hypothetical protein
MIRRFRFSAPLALLLAGVLLPADAAAQSLGVEGGLALSRYKFETSGPETDWLFGGSAGLIFVLSEGPITGQVEALWSRKGTKTTSGTEIKVDYLEIPIGSRLVFEADEGQNIHVMFGGTVAFNLNATQNSEEVFEVIEEDVDEIDFGLFVGGGVDYGRLFANARYVWGIRDISDRPVEAYNRGFTFLVGLKLWGQ